MIKREINKIIKWFVLCELFVWSSVMNYVKTSKIDRSDFSYFVTGPFCNYNMLFLWHSSVDIDKISLFPYFQCFLFREIYEFARTILCKNIMYLKASADVKMSILLEKIGGWGCGSRNGPLGSTRSHDCICTTRMIYLKGTFFNVVLESTSIL